MAEFSKQYCELHDMGYNGDFDIVEEYYLLSQGYSVNLICEGFGSVAIGRGYNDEILLAMLNEDNTVDWVEYDEVLKKLRSIACGYHTTQLNTYIRLVGQNNIHIFI